MICICGKTECNDRLEGIISSRDGIMTYLGSLESSAADMTSTVISGHDQGWSTRSRITGIMGTVPSDLADSH